MAEERKILLFDMFEKYISNYTDILCGEIMPKAIKEKTDNFFSNAASLEEIENYYKTKEQEIVSE